MADIENMIYTELSNDLMLAFPDIYVAGEYVEYPSRFPHVCIEMTDDATNMQYLSTSEKEEIRDIRFEINVYSNKQVGKKTECKKIMNYINDFMYKKNFIRTFCQPVGNANNSAIYRMYGSYNASTDGNHIYRRRY